VADISKLPGVTHAWPTKPVKSVLKKDLNNKKNSNKNESHDSKNKDDDDSEKRIDEYA